LRLLEAAYSQIAGVREIGRSLEGRPIYGLKISDNPALDKAEIDGIFRENLPAMLFLTGRAIDAAPPGRLSLRDRDRRRTLPARFKLFRGTPFSPGD